jgi:hypothetical protein
MTTGTKYCEHHREGLPHCVECETESTRAHDKACVLLAEARAEIEQLRARNAILDNAIAEMIEEQASLCVEEQSITELVAAKDALIEQMREALNLMLEGAIHDFHYVCQHRDNCLCWGCQKVRVKAALSAAERGE